MNKITLSLVLILLFSSCNHKEYKQEMPFDGKTPGSFFYPESLKTSYQELDIKWAKALEGIPHKAPSLSQGILVTSANDKLYAFEIKSGKHLWTVQSSPTNTAPLIRGTKVLWGTLENLTVIDLHSGHILWQKSGRFDANKQIAEFKNEVFVINAEQDLLVFELSSGDTLWHHESNTLIGPLRIDESGIYSPTSEASIIALDRETGERLWESPLGSGRETYFSNFYLENGVLYFPGNRSELIAMNANNGDILWEYDTDAAIRTGFAVDDQHIYFRPQSGYFACVNKKTGSLVWEIETNGFAYQTPIATLNSVLVSTDTGFLFGLDKETGKTMWSAKVHVLDPTPPLLSEGILYTSKNQFFQALEP